MVEHNFPAKPVDCLNMVCREHRKLAQCALHTFRVIPGSLFLQPLLHLLPEGSGSRIGERHNKQAVDVHRIAKIHGFLQNPLDQDRCFAGACRCAYKEALSP